MWVSNQGQSAFARRPLLYDEGAAANRQSGLGGLHDAQPVPGDEPSGTSPHTKAVVERLEISLERADGGITIGELFSNRQSYANKTVRIRGQVTKVNRAIMGKNWVHVQDGTSDAGDYDLTITTIDDAKPGETVTFAGKIVLNKDFGSGYAYDVLMEEAQRQSH